MRLHSAQDNRGAALVVAFVILAALTAIGVVFLSSSRSDLRDATNVTNTVRAELLLEGASAIAIHRLNSDYLNFPDATSNDQPWRTIFNGAWVAGKPWAWRTFDGTRRPLWVLGDDGPGLPQINLDHFRGLFALFPDGVREPLYQGPRTKNWLFIPRAEWLDFTGNANNATPLLYDAGVTLVDLDGTGRLSADAAPNAGGQDILVWDAPDTTVEYRFYAFDLDAPPTSAGSLRNPVGSDDAPFVTPTYYGQVTLADENENGQVTLADENENPMNLPFSDQPAYPAEMVDTWADVDNDGDGLRDSIWIPLPRDLFFDNDGIDNNLNGYTDEAQDNGEDDDGRNGIPDGADRIVAAAIGLDGVLDGDFNDIDEAIEPGVFVYFGGNDGLDNDGDGLVDEQDENLRADGTTKLFLTAPLPGIEIPVDLDGDGVAGDLVPLRPGDDGCGDEDGDGVDDCLEEARFAPLRVRLPDTIRTLDPLDNLVFLTDADVDVIDNDFDLIVNDYSAYAYIGPNNGRIAPRTFDAFNQLPDTGSGVQFEMTLEEGALEPNPPIFNSVAVAPNFSVPTTAGGAPLFPPGTLASYYTNPSTDNAFRYRQLGNWLVGFISGEFVRDEDLYVTQRQTAFVDLNAKAVFSGFPNPDGRENLTFVPSGWLTTSAPANRLLVNDPADDGPRGPITPTEVGELLRALRITHSGEPVCELVGRAAILITDASSKANVNVAGGTSLREFAGNTLPARGLGAQGPVRFAKGGQLTIDSRATEDLGRALNLRFGRPFPAGGASPAEYDVRVLPELGLTLSQRLSALRYGAPRGIGLAGSLADSNIWLDAPVAPTASPLITAYGGRNVASAEYFWDVSFPGYGRVDDNADALLRAFNGIDDDGDGLADEGLFLPPLRLSAYSAEPGESSTPITRAEAFRQVEFAAYVERLGLFEGIDEPGEFRQFRPLRNASAEGSGEYPGLVASFDDEDSDGDGLQNEFGELGDRVYLSLNQLEDVFQIGEGTAATLSDYLGVFGSDRNVTHLAFGDERKTLNKLDFNYASARTIAAWLLVHGNLPRTFQRDEVINLDEVTPAPGFSLSGDEIRAYAAGLRHHEWTWNAPDVNRDVRYAENGFFNTLGGLLGVSPGDLDNIFHESVPASAPQDEDTYRDRNPAAAPYEAFNVLPADAQLSAMQFAVNAVDSRDRDHFRTTITTAKTDLLQRPNELEQAEREAASGASPLSFEALRRPFPNRTGNALPREFLDTAEADAPFAGFASSYFAVPENDVLVPEDVQQFIEDDLGREGVDLDFEDDWWAGQVVSQAPDGKPVAEERHISYTVAGLEAIRINEIMVRPTRRVDGEATPGVFALDWGGLPRTGTYLAPTTDPTAPGSLFLFDPSPYRATVDLNTQLNDGLLPEFVVLAQDLPRYAAQLGVGGAGVEPPESPSSWLIPTGPALGDTAVWSTDRYFVDGDDPDDFGYNPRRDLPNISQHLFLESSGLPAGRYYLTLNMRGTDGTPSIEDDDTDAFSYAIKYVPVVIDDGVVQLLGGGTDFRTRVAGTVLDDLLDFSDEEIFNGFLSSDDYWTTGRGEAEFLAQHFATPPEEHYGQDPNGNLDGRVFLDGAPVVQNDASNGYFERGLYYAARQVGTPSGIPGDFALASLLPSRGDGTVVDLSALPPAQSTLVTEDTHTVTIAPRLEFDVDADNDPEFFTLALCVAVKLNYSTDLGATNDDELAINYFEFSQEPEHEYIELANVSDEAVDIGGWTVEVGEPRRPGRRPSTFFTQMTVPDGTQIAPGGYVLLAPSAFDTTATGNNLPLLDRWQGAPPLRAPIPISGEPLLARNGIGMAAGASGDVAGDGPAPLAYSEPFEIANVSVPPFRDALAFSSGDDFTGSVFERQPFDPRLLTGTYFGDVPARTDYIDNNGDGFRDDFSDELLPGNVDLPDNVDLSGNGILSSATPYRDLPADLSVASRTFTGTADTLANTNRAWDRIIPCAVEFSSDAFPGVASLEAVSNVDDIAQLVLRGGIFPNAPEEDGVDNDGDNRFLDFGGLPRDGELLLDMVDSDGDGLIDEADEGIDEGRTTNALAWAPQDLELLFYRDRRDYTRELVKAFGDAELANPGDPVIVNSDRARNALTGRLSTTTVFIPGIGNVDGFGRFNLPDGVPPDSNPELALQDYVGAFEDPAEWKAFLHKRWYPGDAVFVTLYGGPPAHERIVDQATYTQYDVENRTIDDIVPTPYRDAAGDPLNAIPPRNTIWAPNHMGLDYYRSLERKHPLYGGDLVGTSNRWEATDGAYDDWACSPSVFERVLGTEERIGELRPPSTWTNVNMALVDTSGGTIVPRSTYGRFAVFDPISGDPVPSVRQRFVDQTGNPIDPSEFRLYQHALAGSPLRPNFTQRLMENPYTDGAFGHNLFGSDIPQAYADSRLRERQFRQRNMQVEGALGNLTRNADAPAPYQLPEATGENMVFGRLNPATQTPATQTTETEYIPRADWTLRKAAVRNRPFGSLGDLMTVALMRFEHRTRNDLPTLSFGFDPSATPPVQVPFVRNNPNVVHSTVFDNSAGFRLREAQHNETSLRAAVVGQDRTDPLSDNLLDVATTTLNGDSLVLTMGQADFAPVAPDAGGLSQADVEWQPATTPSGWMPVYLFSLPTDGALASTAGAGRLRLPFYPPYYDGSTPGSAVFVNSNTRAIFNTDFLFGMLGLPGAPGSPQAALANVQTDALAALNAAYFQQRYTIENRVAFYVASNEGDPSQGPATEGEAAEAIFSWDGADGLENGEYYIHLRTFLPGLRQALANVDANVDFLSSAGVGSPLAPAQDVLPGVPPLTPFGLGISGRSPASWGSLLPDPTADGILLDPGGDNYSFEIEIITDASRASGSLIGGVEGFGAPDPGDWNGLRFVPNADGLITVTEGPDSWRPILVQVTDNFLALRIRNTAPRGQLNMLSAVVLAPRRDTPGRINLNTAETRVLPNGNRTQQQLTNVLFGLPGIMDVLSRERFEQVNTSDEKDPAVKTARTAQTGQVPQDSDDIGLPTIGGLAPEPVPELASPEQFARFLLNDAALTTQVANDDLRTVVPPLPARATPLDVGSSLILDADPLAPWPETVAGEGVDNQPVEEADEYAMLRLTSMIESGRTERVDGRYYLSLGELARVNNRFLPPSSKNLQARDRDDPQHHVSPLSNEARPEDRFDEQRARLGALANSATVRSDLFEIILTVQSGFGLDLDGDGFINYRSRDEFVTTAETRARQIYERRVPVPVPEEQP